MRDPEKQREAKRRYKKTPRGKQLHRASGQKRRRELQELVRAAKLQPCVDCGETFDPVCMDFDHRDDNDKVAPVSRLIKTNLQAVIAEMEKCDVVCANCHRFRSHRLRDHSALIRVGKASTLGSPKERAGGREERRKLQELVRAAKSQPCADCNRTFDPVCMDFDHRGNNKIAAVSRLIKMNPRAVTAEMEKCDVVCVCCHRLRTHRLRDHGALIRAKKQEPFNLKMWPGELARSREG